MENTEEGLWQCKERFGWVLIMNLLKLACTLCSDLNAVPMVLPHHWEKAGDILNDSGCWKDKWHTTHQWHHAALSQ